MSEKLNPGYVERAADLREIAAAIRSDDSLTDEGTREIIMSEDDADTCDLGAACIEACGGDPAKVGQMVEALKDVLARIDRRVTTYLTDHR